MASPVPRLFEPHWTFETAMSVWSSARARDMSTGQSVVVESLDDLDFAEADAAETYLLDTAPRREAEAIAILDVVMAQSDFRVDGRDRAALGRVRTFLVGEQRLANPCAPSSSILPS